jgi:PleD family two-component response regulator
LISSKLDIEKNNVNLVHDIVYRVNYKKAINDLRTITKINDFYLDCKSKKRVINDSSKSPEGYQYENFHTDKIDLVNYLNRSISNVNIKLKDYQQNNLAQLSDFLTGSIYGDIVGTQSATKRKLLIYLKNKLHVKKFSEIYNSGGNKKFFISGTYK